MVSGAVTKRQQLLSYERGVGSVDPEACGSVGFMSGQTPQCAEVTAEVTAEVQTFKLHVASR